MKYIRLFEERIIGNPKVGDWVICKSSNDRDIELNQFLATNIGEVIMEDPPEWDYEILYKDAPDWIVDIAHIYDKSIGFDREEILYWSKNKEELEYIVSANKYNL
jgi:hypothetical protein